MQAVFLFFFFFFSLIDFVFFTGVATGDGGVYEITDVTTVNNGGEELQKAYPHHDSAGKLKKASGGRAGFRGGGRTNLLEELGRVEAEPSNRNRRAEVSRIHGELNKGYKKGGRIRKGNGGSAAQQHYLQHGYGPTKAKLRSGKPKIAKKGWA